MTEPAPRLNVEVVRSTPNVVWYINRNKELAAIGEPTPPPKPEKRKK